jgi:hypothetical protein
LRSVADADLFDLVAVLGFNFGDPGGEVNVSVVGDLIGRYDNLNSPTLIQRKARRLVLRLIDINAPRTFLIPCIDRIERWEDVSWKRPMACSKTAADFSRLQGRPPQHLL